MPLGTIPRTDSCAQLLPRTMKLFLPLAAGLMLSSTVGVVDMYIAGFLGAPAQAAVGIGDQLLFLVIVLGTGLSTACSSQVSRAAGAGDLPACRAFCKASLVAGAIAGVISAVLPILFARPILSFLGCEPEVSALALPYTTYNSVANAPFVVSLCLSAIFRALGCPRYSVCLWFVTALLSNGFCFLLFFSGLRSLDALAIGWNLGSFIGCITGFMLLRKAFLESGLDEAAEPPMLPALKELIGLAIPAIVSELSLVIAHFVMYRLLACSSNATAFQAAWTIKIKIEEVLALIPLLALGMSTGVIVGQNLGAGFRDRAVRAAGSIAIASTAFMFLLGALITLSAPMLAGAFCTDPYTRECTETLLLPAIIIFPLTALGSIVCAGMEGAGETRMPMLLNLSSQVAARLGLCYYFAVPGGQGLGGVTLGLCLSQLMMALCSLGYACLRYRGHAPRTAPVPVYACTHAKGMEGT